MAEKKVPSTLIAAAVLMFVSALFNFSWAVSFGVAFFWLIIPICLGFWAITWMVIEITWGVLLLGGKMDKPPLWIPIVEIILGALFLNPFTFGCGIANVILMNRKESKEYFNVEKK